MTAEDKTLWECPACNKAVSRQAATCPHCGHPLVKKNASSPVLGLVTLLVLCGFVAWCALSPTDQSTASNSANAALDQSTAEVKSCSFGDMLEATKGIPTVSGDEASSVCVTMTRLRSRKPEVKVLGAALKASSLISNDGLSQSVPDISYQLMNIVEARDLAGNPNRIIDTFNIVLKIFRGTGGHVTPRDLNVMLRSAGPTAHTLSDDGLISMASLIWEKKKANGD